MVKLEINVPAYNEEKDIPKNIPRLYEFCQKNLSEYDWKIVIVDNASNDATWKKIQELRERHPLKIDGLRLDRKGRGWALRSAWLKSEADLLAYVDADLSPDISALPKMINLLENDYDLVVASRNLPESQVLKRTFLRKLTSKTYVALVKLLHRTRLSDMQCGLKAVRRTAFLAAEPLVENNLWFFDSELIIILEKAGYRVKDVPIRWVDDQSTTVKIAKDSWEEFSGLVRLFKTRPWKKLKKAGIVR